MAFYIVCNRPLDVHPEPKSSPVPESIPVEAIVYDEKEPETVADPVLTREYCSNCITAEGEIKCPRRHRCKSCHCYMTDDEWFAQHKK